MTPKLVSVIRLDSLPLNQTYFTKEGYLLDRPILTSTGIFEYHNPDGSIRRELRLPEDVFDSESLKSYKGKPVIITHDAGLVDSENVRANQIGTILTEGYRSDNDVRAEIIIHDTDSMRECGLKELSLGYNLDLDETPGEWNGQKYDAVQKNIRINHLALVREARAGEQARLNIDSRDSNNALKGGKAVKKTNKTNAQRADSTLSPEEFAKAIEQYKARRAQRVAEKQADAAPVEAPVEETAPAAEPVVKDSEELEPKPVEETAADAEEQTTEEQIQMVKEHRDLRDEAGDPADVETAHGVIAQQDEDIGILFDIIDTLLAKQDFAQADAETVVSAGEVDPIGDSEDEEEEPVVGAAVDGVDCEETNTDADETEEEKEPATVNTDSVDAIVRERIQLGMMGRKLNMDGLEMMSANEARKAIIKAVRPGLRLDGKSETYVKAAYDMAVADIEAGAQKDTSYQKRQMFNKDGRKEDAMNDSSDNARQRMIDRQTKKED